MHLAVRYLIGSEEDIVTVFYYGRTNHVSERCWDKCGQPTWAQIVDASPSDSPTTDCSTSGTRVLIPHSKYESFFIFRLLRLLRKCI